MIWLICSWFLSRGVPRWRPLGWGRHLGVFTRRCGSALVVDAMVEADMRGLAAA
jgi:hypothetical protein